MMSTIIFASALLTLLCVAISYFISNYRRRLPFIEAVDTFPGPRSLPIIGNTYIFVRRNYDDIMYIIDILIHNYPSPFRYWIGNNAFIGIYDADQIKIVLKSKCFDKSIIYETTKPLFGVGLITSPTSTWTIYRKMTRLVFNTNNLQSSFNKFVEYSLVFTNKLEKLNGNEIIFYEHILKCTIDIAYGTLMNVKLESQAIDEAIEIFSSYKKSWTYIAVSTLWNLNAVLNLTKVGSTIQKVLSVRNCLTEKVIEQNKQNKLNKRDTSEYNYTKEKTFFDHFWEAYREEKLTKEEFYDNLCTIMLGASETAVTMYFVVFVLANFPEIQEKVYQELSEIFGKESPKSLPIKYEDLQRMNYLNRVIKETMRLFPAIPGIGRFLITDLKIGKFTLPKGVNVIIPIIHVHRNKKYWPNPLMFDPDRFLPERKMDSSNYYIPFSDGLRNCIGVKYAMMSMKVILATLIRTFEFKIDKKIDIDEIKLRMNISIEPVNPIKVKIEKRSLQ